MNPSDPDLHQRWTSEGQAPLGMLLADMVEEQELSKGLAEVGVNGLESDSRKIRPGNAFLAFPGTLSDGRRHVSEAMEAGASVVIFEKALASDRCHDLEEQGCAVGMDNLRERLGILAARWYANPSAGMKVTGVTGTNGKTTCAWLLAQALEILGERCVVMGTIGSGFPGNPRSSSLTTQDAIVMQRDLKHWLDQGATAVCMEVSSHGLDQGRVNGVRFNVALFTNLTRDHLDYHGDMKAYGEAKKTLFRMPGLDAVVSNRDDVLGREILEFADTPVQISYGLRNADVTPIDPRFRSTGTEFDWQWGKGRFRCRSVLIGSVNLQNLLAVIATLLAHGHEPERIETILPRLKPPPGRMEFMGGGERLPAVVVDYAHTPDSLGRSLESLRTLTEGRLEVVFGCGGDRDPGKRTLMGAVAARHADSILITNDNPRGEDPQHIADSIRQGVMDENPASSCRIELDRMRAIRMVLRQASPGDLVLVAGKGHENTQTIGTARLPFSDREIVLAELGRMSC